MEALRGHLDLLLLAALARGPGHGYALIERLRDDSDGAFDFPEGTIYPALHKLEADQLVVSRWAEAVGRRRRVYRLTRRGRSLLARRRTAWRDFVRAVDAVVAT